MLRLTRLCAPTPRLPPPCSNHAALLHDGPVRLPRFDVIGGVFYFLLVVSVLPRCNRMAELLEADTLGEAEDLGGACATGGHAEAGAP